MTKNNNFFRLFSFFLLSFFLYGCSGGSSSGGDTGAVGPAASGSHRVCYYTSNLASSGYASARVSYPCDLQNGPYAATTLTGGFTNTKEQMYWLTDHLVTHGYVVITMTPTNVFGTPPVWERAHLAGIEKLLSENLRTNSPIRGKIKASKLNVMGFSMGGGGALLAANTLRDQVQGTIALAPWLGGSRPALSGIAADTMLLAGSRDTTASASSIESYYEVLPTSIDRALAVYSGATHLDWINTGNNHNKFKTLIVSWMKVYLDGDTAYQTYLDGAQHSKNVAERWYTNYDYQN